MKPFFLAMLFLVCNSLSGFAQPYSGPRGLSKSSQLEKTNWLDHQYGSGPINDTRYTIPFFAQGASDCIFHIAVLYENIYVTGNFLGADDIYSPNIIMWDGKKWNAMSNGQDSSKYSNIYNILPDGQGGVYTVGVYGQLGGLKSLGMTHWNGSVFQDIRDTSIGQPTGAMTLWNNQLIVATVKGFYRKDSNAWTKIAGFPYGKIDSSRYEKVNKIIIYNNQLWVVGRLFSGIDTTARNVLVLKNNQLVNPGFGIDHEVTDIAVFNNEMFFIESEWEAYTGYAIGLDKWNGQQLSKIQNSGPSDYYAGFGSDSNSLFLVGGNNTNVTVDNVSASVLKLGDFQIMKWTGNDFQVIQRAKIDGWIFEVSLTKNGIVVCGNFSKINNTRVDNLALFRANQWQAVSTGLNPGPNFTSGIMVSDGKQLLFGQSGNSDGGICSGGILRWDGFKWDSLGGGFKVPKNKDTTNIRIIPKTRQLAVNAILSNGNQLIVGGLFDSTLTGAAQNIATWDGNSWKGLGEGFRGEVNDILLLNNQLVVGGNEDVNPIDLNPVDKGMSIASWDGNKWAKIGKGLTGNITKLISYNGNIYACGGISLYQESAQYSLVYWDNIRWNGMYPISNISDLKNITNMVVYQNKLLLGTSSGSIIQFGDTTNIAAFLKFNGYINLNLMVHDSDLYVCGRFISDSLGKAQVAKWNGKNWTLIGGELFYPSAGPLNVAMTIFGNYLYLSAQGVFEVNGKNPYRYLRYSLNPGLNTKFSGNPKNKFVSPKSALSLPGYSKLPSGWEAFDPSGREANVKSAAGVRFIPK